MDQLRVPGVLQPGVGVRGRVAGAGRGSARSCGPRGDARPCGRGAPRLAPRALGRGRGLAPGCALAARRLPWGEPAPGAESAKVARLALIVIDPGHGGEDPGAIGRLGSREKDITLTIARRLKALVDAEPNMRA